MPPWSIDSTMPATAFLLAMLAIHLMEGAIKRRDSLRIQIKHSSVVTVNSFSLSENPSSAVRRFKQGGQDVNVFCASDGQKMYYNNQKTVRGVWRLEIDPRGTLRRIEGGTLEVDGRVVANAGDPPERLAFLGATTASAVSEGFCAPQGGEEHYFDRFNLIVHVGTYSLLDPWHIEWFELNRDCRKHERR